MKLLYRDSPIFIGGLEYAFGNEARNLEQLKEAGLLAGPSESLSQMGYQMNRTLSPTETLLSLTTAPLAALLGHYSTPSSLVFQHCHSESAVLPLDPEDKVGASRNRYFPAAVMKELKLDHIPYFCSYASGCAGFISVLISAAGVLNAGDNGPILCVLADSVPVGGFADMMRERILGSDHASAFAVGKEKQSYQLLGLAFYSSTRAVVPLMEVVKRAVAMTQELAASLEVDLSEAVLHYPNIFPDTWKMVTRYLKIPKATTVSDGMAERGHCGSSDSVITLAKTYRGEEGRLHVVVNYGVGLHLGVCILKEMATP